MSEERWRLNTGRTNFPAEILNLTIDEKSHSRFQLKIRVHSRILKEKFRSVMNQKVRVAKNLTADIAAGNQRRINIIQVLRWFKAVMQEDEIFQTNERNLRPKLAGIIPSVDNRTCLRERQRTRKKDARKKKIKNISQILATAVAREFAWIRDKGWHFSYRGTVGRKQRLSRYRWYF